MSMHEIEDLVECSVLVVAAAEPAPQDAPDICHSLYELQDQFDCGYTVLRVWEQLKGLGYLFLIPPEELPEPERSQALSLGGESGFFGTPPETFFDGEKGCACVTAGSPLWEKLRAKGVIKAAPVRRLPLLELAARVTALAGGDKSEIAATALGYWYTVFPALVVTELDGDCAETQAQALALRDAMATPEALAFAAGWGLLPDMDDDWEYDDFEREWLAPYDAFRKMKEAESSLACQEKVMEALGREDFSSALEQISQLPEGSQRRFCEALLSLGYHQSKAASPEAPPLKSGAILSLEEARDAFRSLLGGNPETDYLCNTYLSACYICLKDYDKAFDALRDAFEMAMEQLRDMDDETTRQFSQATLAVAFYHSLWFNLPEGPERQRMMTARAGQMPTLQEARETFARLLDKMEDRAWLCRYNTGICLLLEGDRDGVLREVTEADRLHPGQEEVQAMLQFVTALPEN